MLRESIQSCGDSCDKNESHVFHANLGSYSSSAVRILRHMFLHNQPMNVSHLMLRFPLVGEREVRKRLEHGQRGGGGGGRQRGVPRAHHQSAAHARSGGGLCLYHEKYTNVTISIAFNNLIDQSYTLNTKIILFSGYSQNSPQVEKWEFKKFKSHICP